MRILLFALIILAYASPLQADNVLQNGDFSNGKEPWHGDGQTPDEYARDNQDNLSATPDPLTSKGLIVHLKPNRWTHVSQAFKGDKNTHYVLTVTYKVSPDMALSNKAADYTNIPALIRYEGYEGSGPINIETGRFWITVTDLANNDGYQERFAPKLGASQIQTFLDHGLPMPPMGNKVVVVAFPPGTGTVVILNVSVTSS